MPTIELELSQEVYSEWRRFLASEPAGRLTEAGQLGNWVATGFMSHVEQYLEKGTPLSREETLLRKKERQAATARKELTKQQRRILPIYNENDQLTVDEISRILGLMPEEGHAVVDQWVADGFLDLGPGRDGEKAYVLGQAWITHNLTANRPSLNVLRVPHLMRPIDLLDKDGK